jgi:hypothetical protein
MNDKQTQQIQCWIEDNFADVNSSDLFEQAKAYDLGIGVKEDKHKAASLYREAMNQGDKKAKHNLAMLLVTEEGDLSDKPAGIQMLQELADEGETYSIYSLGGCYMNGQGVTQDIDKGLELYHTASNMGLGIATYSIAAYHFNECHNIETGMTYCEKAAEQGFALAASILEQIYEEGMGVEKDMDKAMTYMKQAAELGDARCQLKYGMLLCRTDRTLGAEWMIKSAYQKNPAALLIVGQEYLNSDSPLFSDLQHFYIGVQMLREAADLGVKEASEFLAYYGLEQEQSLDERVAWFYNILDEADRDTAQRAFQQMYACSEIGDPIAQCIMGMGYYYGTFVEQDKEKGMMLLKKACDCDCTDALNTIGMVLNEEKRYEESFPYHQRSAEKGDMYGLHNLGNAYFYARGVEQDIKKAYSLWGEAAVKGNPDSHYTLGNLFFRGEYVEQNIPLAIKGYTFAASHPCNTQRMAMEQLVQVYQMIGNEKEADEWNAKLNEIE